MLRKPFTGLKPKLPATRLPATETTQGNDTTLEEDLPAAAATDKCAVVSLKRKPPLVLLPYPRAKLAAVPSSNKENASSISGIAHPISVAQKSQNSPTLSDGSSFLSGKAAGVLARPRPATSLPTPACNVAVVLQQQHGLPASHTQDIGKTFRVLYTKKELMQKKKANKKYQDGILALQNDMSVTLYDMEGKVVYKGKAKLYSGRMANDSDDDNTASNECKFEMGSWFVEVDQPLDSDKFRNGLCFVPNNDGPAPIVRPGVAALKAFKPMAAITAGTAPASKPAAAAAPLHDPFNDDALVLNADQWQQGKGTLPNGRLVVPVVVDPYLGRHLRPHQQQGVRFMYEAVMGLRQPDKLGCILADEMGLGKTLQLITLMWTLLRQGPEGKPVANKIIVVAPATLVQNWAKEVKKWLGTERLPTMTVQQSQDAKQKVLDFKLGLVHKVLITSYETLRKLSPDLVGVCDLLVCDEGHRLKAVGGNKTIESLLQLGCRRRVLLTGTPVQNNLDEFYALLSFVVPDLLGSAAVFKRVYGDPIAKSKERDATEHQKAIGADRAAELKQQVEHFVLRRTQDILAKHLPPLSVCVVFCKPSQMQVDIYQAILHCKCVSSLLYGRGSSEDIVLSVITALRKVCNHPSLLHKRKQAADKEEAAGLQGSNTSSLSAWMPEAAQQLAAASIATQDSGKMACLEALLRSIIASGERAVVVSTSTATLDTIQAMVCAPSKLKTVRIDGGTSVEDRQSIVDNFNLHGIGQVFMLSTRAGGAGLNLVGANHLVLYDSDWNPAMDQQAMARIWRDGQTKPCHVYRLLTTGTMDEKVYQRQIMKGELAAATVADSSRSGSFTQEELRSLFSLDTATCCDTHKLLSDSHGKQEEESWLFEPQKMACVSRDVAAAVATGMVTCIHRTCKGKDAAAEHATARAQVVIADTGSPSAISMDVDVQQQRCPAHDDVADLEILDD